MDNFIPEALYNQPLEDYKGDKGFSVNSTLNYKFLEYPQLMY